MPENPSKLASMQRKNYARNIILSQRLKEDVVSELQKISCNKCGSHNFDYDPAWKEYSCEECGYLVEDTDKIAMLNKMRNDNQIRNNTMQENNGKPLEEVQNHKEESKKDTLTKVERLRQEKDVEDLIKKLTSSDYKNATEALRQIGDKRAVDPLIKAFEHYFAEGKDCRIIVQALREFGQERAVAPLSAVLEENYCGWTDAAELRYFIVAAFGAIGGERAIKALIKALSDTSSKSSISPIALPSVGDHARGALMNIGKPALGALHRALEDEKTGWIRKNIKETIEWIQENSSGEVRIDSPFVEVVTSDVQDVFCENCGFDGFEYDRVWKEYSCKECGEIVEDPERIAAIQKTIRDLTLLNSTKEKSAQGPSVTSSAVVGRDRDYLAYANGVVRNTKTELEWTAGPDKGMTWDQAKAWVERHNRAGGGWRMPTMDELEGLYEEGLGDRNMTSLLKLTGWWVWSGVTQSWLRITDNCYDFFTGRRYFKAKTDTFSCRVFAVRTRSDR